VHGFNVEKDIKAGGKSIKSFINGGVEQETLAGKRIGVPEGDGGDK
jgi:hypothetical protein